MCTLFVYTGVNLDCQRFSSKNLYETTRAKHMVMCWLLIIWSILMSSVVSYQNNDSKHGMFTVWSDQWLEMVDTNQKNYGMAVSDVDNDGRYDVIVAGFNGPNLVLKFLKERGHFVNIATIGSPYEALMDEKGQAIGVGACDIDGDGREEIYVLNTNDAYAGVSSYSDKLFKWRDGKYIDLFGDDINHNVTSRYYAGRSVACVDRYGIGRYGFVIANYAHRHPDSGRFALIEMDDYNKYNNVEMGTIALKDCAKEAGLDKSTGGRGVVVGPILNSDGKSDIVFVNEGNALLHNPGDNHLFQNLGNGSYSEVGGQLGISDEVEAGRGVALADFNDDGLFDIIYGNFDGLNRLYMQSINTEGQRQFTEIATPELAAKCVVRSLLVADFDNDGKLEIFLNNIDNFERPVANKLFTVTSYGARHEPGISTVDPGDAAEPDGYGTGAVYLDVDGDGLLDLLISHGEVFPQPIEVYRSSGFKGNNYLRIQVFTKFGAPAHGATVSLRTQEGRSLHQVIDGGSGYLCQMEPIAHFGLGSDRPVTLTVQWTDGRTHIHVSKEEDINTILLFFHPSYDSYQSALKASNLTSQVLVNSSSHIHGEL